MAQNIDKKAIFYSIKINYLANICATSALVDIFMQAKDLDSADRKILNQLQKDATLSAASVGEAIGLSQSSCSRRMQRLRDAGFIRREVALLDRKKVGFDTQIFAQVRISAHERDGFSEAIRGYPEVLECHVILGPFDFLLRIVVENVEQYEKFFFERLSRLPGIQEVNSSITLSEVKYTTALAL